MNNSDNIQIRKHAHDCSCSHDHKHDHDHDHDHSHHQHSPFGIGPRWGVSIVIIVVLLIVLRPFILGQLQVRVTSYATASMFNDAVRLSEKIISLDPNNIQAWDSMGYAYMDMSNSDMAKMAFEKVIQINPQDHGAASFELGQIFYDKGNYPDAIQYFERVRQAGPRASELLEADILKYRHGTFGFRSLNSMETLLGDLLDCYQKTGHSLLASQVQEEYNQYKHKHSKLLF